MKPERGRVITHDDDKTGAPYVAVLSHDFGCGSLAAIQQIVGKTIPLSGNVYTIIGVMPASFASPRDNTEAWTPVTFRIPWPQIFAASISCALTAGWRRA